MTYEHKAFAAMEETAEFVSRIDKKMDRLKDTRDTLRKSILFTSQANFRDTHKDLRFTAGKPTQHITGRGTSLLIEGQGKKSLPTKSVQNSQVSSTHKSCRPCTLI